MEHQDIMNLAWDKLPHELRIRAVSRMREILDPLFFTQLQDRMTSHGEDWMPVGWHFSQGMAIRNLLRSDHGLDPQPKHPPIPDADLPPLPEYYGEDVSNWDDYYAQVLEACVGFRAA